MQVPAFLLRRLYQKGSLRNEPDGFAFELKNTLGSGYAESALPLTVDGEAISMESAAFVVDGDVKPFAEVSADNPMTLGMQKAVTVRVSGTRLPPGKHKIGIGFVVTGMGKMEFDVTDAIEPDEAHEAAS